MFEKFVRIGLPALTAAALTLSGTSTAAAAPVVDLHPDGWMQFRAVDGEQWGCLALSLAAPYFSLQLGPGHRAAHFTPGIDVAVTCLGTRGTFGFTRIVHAG